MILACQHCPKDRPLTLPGDPMGLDLMVIHLREQHDITVESTMVDLADHVRRVS